MSGAYNGYNDYFAKASTNFKIIFISTEQKNPSSLFNSMSVSWSCVEMYDFLSSLQPSQSDEIYSYDEHTRVNIAHQLKAYLQKNSIWSKFYDIIVWKLLCECY
jgi:hypothetical protein